MAESAVSTASVQARRVVGRPFPKGDAQRETARKGAFASQVAKRARQPLRLIATEGYREAVRALLDELHRLRAFWERGKSPETTARKLVYVAEVLAKHTKHVLPISVQADILHSLTIPTLPDAVAAELRALAPTREALAALPAPPETVDAEFTDLEAAPVAAQTQAEPAPADRPNAPGEAAGVPISPPCATGGFSSKRARGK